MRYFDGFQYKNATMEGICGNFVSSLKRSCNIDCNWYISSARFQANVESHSPRSVKAYASWIRMLFFFVNYPEKNKMDKWLFEQINYLCQYIKYIASNVLIFSLCGGRTKKTLLLCQEQWRLVVGCTVSAIIKENYSSLQ